MLQRALVLAALVAADPVFAAQPCEALRDQIDAKVRAAGVIGYTVAIVDADAKAGGKVVGTCDLGRKKIVYTAASASSSGATASASSVHPKASGPPLLTECKDGSVSLGGDCK